MSCRPTTCALQATFVSPPCLEELERSDRTGEVNEKYPSEGSAAGTDSELVSGRGMEEEVRTQATHIQVVRRTKNTKSGGANKMQNDCGNDVLAVRDAVVSATWARTEAVAPSGEADTGKELRTPIGAEKDDLDDKEPLEPVAGPCCFELGASLSDRLRSDLIGWVDSEPISQRCTHHHLNTSAQTKKGGGGKQASAKPRHAKLPQNGTI